LTNCDFALVKQWRRNLTGESGLGNPEPHILLSKIFGIKMHRIGKDRCEAICQAPKQNQKQNKTHIVMQPEIHHLLMIADMVGPKE